MLEKEIYEREVKQISYQSKLDKINHQINKLNKQNYIDNELNGIYNELNVLKGKYVLLIKENEKELKSLRKLPHQHFYLLTKQVTSGNLKHVTLTCALCLKKLIRSYDDVEVIYYRKPNGQMFKNKKDFCEALKFLSGVSPKYLFKNVEPRVKVKNKS